MAAPINTSGLLQVDNDGGGNHTFNAGFTFTAGNDAVLTITHYGDSTNAITGVTIGGTTATAIASNNKVSGSFNSVRIYLAQNITGGTANVVITYSGGSDNYMSGSVEEWEAGVLEASAVDTGTANTASGSSATPSVSTATSTSQANTIIYAALVMLSSSTSNNISGPTGWTVTWTEQDSTNHEGGRGAWKEETTTGTKTATFGMNSNGWGAAIVALKLASSTSVSGTLNKTNANDTSAASGTTTIVSSLIKTNTNDTSSASGTTTVVSTLSITNANDTGSASGSVGSPVSGTVSVTNTNDTSTGTATTTIVASLAKTNTNDSLSSQVTTTVLGSLAVTNINDTSSANGSVGSAVSSIASITNTNDTLSAAATTTVVTTLAFTNSNDTLSGVVSTTVVSSLAETMNNDTLAASGTSGTPVVGTGTRLPLTGAGAS